MHELFKKRKSVRKFKDQAVEPAKIDEILEAANSAPSAGNLKARKIIVVWEKEIREKISEAAFGQDSVIKAPVALVFIALPRISARKYSSRGENLYAIQDATIAASFAWIEAVNLGLSSCWVGGFEENDIKEILGLGTDEKPVAILPIGYGKGIFK
ncbi:MAG: nitroreductase family protein [Parcubacteria group bacterium]|jgi:nitroreductase